MGSVRRVVWLSHDAPSFFFWFLQASGGGVLHRSIGIEPPRLHCGRSRGYGSIIVPNTCRRLHRGSPALSCSESHRSPSGRGALSKAAQGFQPGSVEYCLMLVFSFQGSLGIKALKTNLPRLLRRKSSHYIRRWVVLVLDIFIFPLTFQWTFFRPVCQVSHRIYFFCCRQRAARAEALSSHARGHFLRN